MSEQEMLDKIKELEERNKFLENIVNRGSSGNTSAYNAIRLMIIEKVQKEVELPETFMKWSNIPTWIQEKIKKADNYVGSNLEKFVLEYEKNVKEVNTENELSSEDDLPF